MSNNNVTTTVKNWLNEKELDLVKKQFFPQTASQEDISYCLEVSRQLGLNPIIKQIHYVPRKAQNEQGIWTEKTEPMISRDGFLSIAHKSGKFGGMETTAEIKNTPVIKNGEWVEKKDLVAVCKVWRNDSDKAFVVEVAYAEYVQTKKDGSPTKFWAEKPQTMIKKVAESQALRKAFNINGVLSAEEVGYEIVNNGEIYIDAEAEEASVDIEAENEKLIESEKNALEQLGLNFEYKDGFIKAVGNNYGKEGSLKLLGYTFHQAKKIWVKKLF